MVLSIDTYLWTTYSSLCISLSFLPSSSSFSWTYGILKEKIIGSLKPMIFLTNHGFYNEENIKMVNVCEVVGFNQNIQFAGGNLRLQRYLYIGNAKELASHSNIEHMWDPGWPPPDGSILKIRLFHVSVVQTCILNVHHWKILQVYPIHCAYVGYLFFSFSGQIWKFNMDKCRTHMWYI